MARRRRRRYRFRLKPAGYAFFGGVLLLVGLGIFFIIRAIVRNGEKEAALAATPSPTASMEPATPSPTPTAAPTAAPVSTTVPDVAATPIQAEQAATAAKATAAPAKATSTPSSSIRKATSSEKKNAKAAYLSGDGVNLRVGPSTDYMSLGKYGKNSTLVVYATDGKFYFVKMDKDGKVGFLSKSFVEISASAPKAESVAVPSDAVNGSVTAGTVAMRDGASKESNAIKELHSGDQVFIYYKTGDFYYLADAASGRKGFAYANYISASGTVPVQ